MSRLCALLLAGSLAGALGCGGPRALNTQLAQIERIAQDGREQGAYRCAPEELALATAHLEFAHLELAQGDLVRAREHLVIADANARAAVRLSAQLSCAEAGDGAPEARVGGRSIQFVAEACALRTRSIYGHVRS